MVSKSEIRSERGRGRLYRSVIRFGIMTFTSFGDAEVKRSVGKILKAPLYTVLGEEMFTPGVLA